MVKISEHRLIHFAIRGTKGQQRLTNFPKRGTKGQRRLTDFAKFRTPEALRFRTPEEIVADEYKAYPKEVANLYAKEEKVPSFIGAQANLGVYISSYLSNKKQTLRYAERQAEVQKAEKRVGFEEEMARKQEERDVKMFDFRKSMGLPTGTAMSREPSSLLIARDRLRKAKDILEVAGDRPFEKTANAQIMESKTRKILGLRADISKIEGELHMGEDKPILFGDPRITESLESKRSSLVKTLLNEEREFTELDKRMTVEDEFSLSHIAESARREVERRSRDNVYTPNRANQLARDVVVGAAGTIEGMLGVVEWMGIDETIPMKNKIEKWRKELEPENPNFVDQVFMGAGSAATFFIPGLGVMKGATVFAKVSTRLALLFGGSMAAGLESATEAGSSYNDLIANGYSHAQASERAQKVFYANMILVSITNRLGIFGDRKRILYKALTSSSMEALQEGSQQLISNTYTDRPLWEGVTESMAVGGIIGGGMGVVVDFVQKAQDADIDLTLDRVENFADGGEDAELQTIYDTMTPQQQNVFGSLLSGENRLVAYQQEGRPGIDRPAMLQGEDILFDEGVLLPRAIGERRLPGLEGDEAIRKPDAELEDALPRATRGLVNKLQRQIDKLRESRAKTAEAVKGKREIIQGIKQEIVDFARKNLPLRERGKLLAMVKNAKTDLDYERAIARMGKLGEEADVRDIKTRIEKELKGIEPKKKGGIPRGKFEAEAHRKLATIKEHVKMDRDIAQAKIAENIRNAPEEGLTTEMIAENELLAMAGLKDMDAARLQDVLRNIQSTKETGRTIRELRAFNRSEAISRWKEGVKEDMSGGKRLQPAETFEENRGLFNALKTLDNWLHGIDTMFEKLSRTPGQEQFTGPLGNLARKVHDARTVQNEGMQGITKTIQDNFKRIFNLETRWQAVRQVAANKKKVLLGTFKRSDGVVLRDWRMSQNEMYKKWMEWQDPSLRSTFKAMGWTDEMVGAIEGKMTPEIRAWADWQLREFYPEYGRTIAPVFEDRFGAPFPLRENYSPIKREGFKDVSLDESLLDTAFHLSSVTPGGVKARVDTDLRLAMMDGDEVLMRHVVEMEHFKAFEDTIRGLRAIFGDGEVRETMRQFHGRDAPGTVSRIINNIARDGHDTAEKIKLADYARSSFTKAKLGLNPTVLIKQLTSIPAYITEMPNSSATQFAIGIADFWRHPLQNTRILMSHPDMKARYELGAMERDVKFAMSKGHDKKMMTGKDNFLNSLMFTTKVGDRLAILQGGWAVYRTNLKVFLKKGLPIDQARKEALDKFMAATNRTQQAGAPEHLSRIQTTGGSWGRLFTMFMTAPQQYYRIVSRSMRGLVRNRGSKTTNAKNLFVAWVLLPSLFQFVADGFTYKKERQARAAMIGPLNGIPALGNMYGTIARALTGDDVYFGASSPGPLQVFDNVSSAIKRMTKEEVTTEDFYKALDDIATAASDLTGVPYGPASRPVKGAMALTSGETNDLRRLIFSKYALGDEKKKEKKSPFESRLPTRTTKSRFPSSTKNIRTKSRLPQ